MIWIPLNKYVSDRIPKKYYKILLREIETLRADENVLAIGLAGSLARGDVWEGSDIDIQVIIRRDCSFNIILRFEDIEIDTVYISKNQAEKLSYDVIPIYDPQKIIEETLNKKNTVEFKMKMLSNTIEQAKEYRFKAKKFLDLGMTYSFLSNIHQAAREIAQAFILSMNGAPSYRRTISRLEWAMRKRGTINLLKKYLTLYNMSDNLVKVAFFYDKLKVAYEKIWDHLKEKGIGIFKISDESTFQDFFKCRIEPIYSYDKRDFICFVFNEFQFILTTVFKLEEQLDKNTFNKAKLNNSSLYWINIYREILETIPFENATGIYKTTQLLMEEL